MGFTDRETVALLCGGHVYGRCHPDNRGYAGAWVEKPYEWSNEYAADMVGDMIAFHDTSGNNSLSFADFLRIVRTAGPSVLDLDGGGSARRR